MIDRCLGDDELGELEGLPPDDRRSQHVEQCPRCRARLRSYREFMAEAGPPATAGERLAREAVSAALEREIFGATASQNPMAPPSSLHRARRSFAWLPEALRPPVLRPALAVAAVVLIGFGVVQVARQLGEGGPTGTVRGGAGGDGAAAMSVARVVLADGRPALSWTRLPAAEDYEVLLIGADLTELGRVAVGADSLLVLEPGRLPAAAARESALVCRIVARRGGDEIGRSNLVPLGPVPR
jgi:hypothetical protein